MIPHRSNILTDLPPALEKRLKLIDALARHTAQDHRAALANIGSGPTIRETYPELAALWQWLILKYSADQPRVPAGNVDGGQWTSGSAGEASIASNTSAEPPGSAQPVRIASLETGTVTDTSPAPLHETPSPATQYAGPTQIVIDPSAHTGIEQIDNTTEKLAEILGKTIDGVSLLPGEPQQYGIVVHVAFAIAVAAAGIRGISPLDVERSFKLPPGYSLTKDSVRPDVVLRNDIGDIIAIYDVKTGDEGIRRSRAAELRAAAGVDSSVPVIELSVRRGVLLKVLSRRANQEFQPRPTKFAEARI